MFIFEDYHVQQKKNKKIVNFCWSKSLFSAIIQKPMEKSCCVFAKWTKVKLTSMLAYKNTSSLKHSISHIFQKLTSKMKSDASLAFTWSNSFSLHILSSAANISSHQSLLPLIHKALSQTRHHSTVHSLIFPYKYANRLGGNKARSPSCHHN